uniref:Secreted protein n=1 Tax=Gouania willdenowi TaxID=441366 RepID=A0A8C5GYM3_GOUWI
SMFVLFFLFSFIINLFYKIINASPGLHHSTRAINHAQIVVKQIQPYFLETWQSAAVIYNCPNQKALCISPVKWCQRLPFPIRIPNETAVLSACSHL